MRASLVDLAESRILSEEIETNKSFGVDSKARLAAKIRRVDSPCFRSLYKREGHNDIFLRTRKGPSQNVVIEMLTQTNIF